MEPETELRPPVFENPPIIEVVCGVSFERLAGLMVPHLGLLWEKYRPEFSRFQEAIPLAVQIERPEGTVSEADIMDLPQLPRVQFRNAKGDAMIQVQRERFHYNWQKAAPEDRYPRFEAIFAQYINRLYLFKKFLKENELPALGAKQFELTYVNHLPAGEGWESVADIGCVFPDLAWRRSEGRAKPESVWWRASFQQPDINGRLHVSIRSAKRAEDKKMVLVAEFTVRGMSGSENMEAMRDWFQRAHDHIVSTFGELCSQEIQKSLWRRVK